MKICMWTVYSGQHFCFTVPEKCSFIYNKIIDSSNQKNLESYLKKFLSLKEGLHIEVVLDSVEHLALGQEEKKKEGRRAFK